MNDCGGLQTAHSFAYIWNLELCQLFSTPRLAYVNFLLSKNWQWIRCVKAGYCAHCVHVDAFTNWDKGETIFSTRSFKMNFSNITKCLVVLGLELVIPVRRFPVHQMKCHVEDTEKFHRKMQVLLKNLENTYMYLTCTLTSIKRNVPLLLSDTQ